MTDVIDFNEKRAEKNKSKYEKISQVEIMSILCDAINRDPRWEYPPFPEEFKVFMIERSKPQIVVKTKDGSLDLTNEKAVEIELVKYCDKLRIRNSIFSIDSNFAKKTVQFWMATAPWIKTPKIFGWKDDPEEVFSRLPWHYDDDAVGKFPVMLEFLSRLTNREAVVLFIGSIFDGASNLEQYLWLYGEGQDGKSSIAKFLNRVLKSCARNAHPPGRDDRFWNTRLVGTRLMVFPDCSSRSWVASGAFKSLTGNDAIDVEFKGGGSITYRHSAKFMFLSNELPAVSSEKADRRRIVLSEVLPFAGEPDPDYDAKLWEEGGAFLSYCIRCYQDFAKAHGHRPIPSVTDLLEHVTAANEEEFSVIFEKYFEPCSKTEVPGQWVTAQKMQTLIQEVFHRDRSRENQFRKFLQVHYGVSCKVVRESADKIVRKYPGIKSKSPFDT